MTADANSPKSLDAETRLAINEYVQTIVERWGKWLGIANGSAIVAGLIYLFFVLPQNVANQASANLNDSFKSQIQMIVEARSSAETARRAAEDASETIKAAKMLVGTNTRVDIENGVRLLELAKSTGQLEQMPKGAVVAFNLGACPAGWIDYVLAYGRFIRGIDKQGSNDPDGIRVSGSLQADAFQGHWHNIYTNAPGKTADGLWGSTASKIDLFTRSSQMNATAVEIGSDTVNGTPRIGLETRPKNVSLLYCERK